MRKFMLGGLLAAVCTTTAFAKDFPYDASLTQRYLTNSTTLASYDLVEVPAVNGGMTNTENVAVITMADAVVTALDEDGWTESTNKLTNIQAAFTLKSVSDDSNQCVWMGYTGGEWKEFTGADATSGTYTIKIEIDYTLTAPKVRYFVGTTVMKQGDNEWVPLGNDAAKVNGVQLCGYGTTGAVEGKAGERAAEGAVAVTEDVSANYESIRLGVTATQTWGVDKVQVIVKDSTGAAIGTAQQALSNAVEGVNFIDLASDLVLEEGAQGIHPGETYTYEVSLTDGKRSTQAERSDSVDLFSSDIWFAFDNENDTFVNATTTGIVIAEHKFSAADEEVEGTITPTEPKTNVGTVVETTIDVSNVCTDLQDYTEDIPQFAVALGGTSAARVWKYCEDGVWTNSATAGLPTTNGTYVGRATFDYASHKVKYEIRAEDSSEYLVLVNGASLPTDDTRLNKVGLLGGGTISAMQAKLKLVEPPVIKPENDQIVLEKNAEVDLAKLDRSNYTVTSAAGKNCHLKWKDDKTGGGKFAVMNGNQLTVMTGAPTNGLASYNSYVLGLDATKEDSKPAAVVVAGQNQTGGVVVNVPNLKGKTRPELGYTIKLRVMESTNGTDWEPVSGGSDHDVNENVTVPLFDDSGKRYRVDTIIK